MKLAGGFFDGGPDCCFMKIRNERQVAQLEQELDAALVLR